jgi:hypothetical protein
VSEISSKALGVALLSTLLATVVAGCTSSEPPTSNSADQRLDRYAVTAVVPSGWHQVPLVHLPGAVVPLEVASFPADGAVQTICDPRSIVKQIPAGGALLQILQDSGSYSRRLHLPGAVSSPRRPGDYPPLAKPFRLGPPQSHECGEAYDVVFRKGSRGKGVQVLQLRIWTAPGGLSRDVHRQIDALMESLRVRPS